MRAAFVLVLALGPGCASVLRSAPGHDPAAIYQRTHEISPIPSPSPAARVTVALRMFEGEILAPTGAYLDDLAADGPMVETYVTDNVKEALFARVAGALEQRGLVVERVYDMATPIPAAMPFLDVRVTHFELHRWRKKELFARNEGGVVDLVRIDYQLAWQRAAPITKRHELAIEPKNDALDLTALYITEAALAALPVR